MKIYSPYGPPASRTAAVRTSWRVLDMVPTDPDGRRLAQLQIVAENGRFAGEGRLASRWERLAGHLPKDGSAPGEVISAQFAVEHGRSPRLFGVDRAFDYQDRSGPCLGQARKCVRRPYGMLEDRTEHIFSKAIARNDFQITTFMYNVM